MQKLFILFALVGGTYLPASAQKKLEKTLDYAPNQKIELNFERATVITVKTWDQNQVRVNATASINKGENDQAFELQSEITDGTLRFVSNIVGWEQIPRKHYTNEYGDYYSVLLDISLEVMVPRHATSLNVSTKDGLIWISGFNGTLYANSKNGEVDVSLPQNQASTLELRTKNGEIYTNFSLDKGKSTVQNKEYDKWNIVSFQLNGGGKVVDLDSKNGNIYLRKL
jgi:hypothetical protein